MKIRSREQEDITRVGSGPFILAATKEQLRFIAALCFSTRLGTSTYKEAVFDLLVGIEAATNEHFAEESFNLIQPEITETNDRGSEIRRISTDNFIIEV